MANLEGYKLYYRSSCPFCVKVLRFMEKNGITLQLCDTTQPGVRDELVKIGGKGQVPCLVMGEKALYESDDIIAFLRREIAEG